MMKFFAPTWSKLITFFVVTLVLTLPVPLISYVDISRWLMARQVLGPASSIAGSMAVPLLAFGAMLYRYALSCFLVWLYQQARKSF